MSRARSREDLKVLKQQPDGSATPFDALFLSLPPQAVSNDKVLFWRMQEIGQHLELGFNAPKAGKYRMVARFLRRNNGGTFQMAINGQALGTPVDLYGPPQGDQYEAALFSGGSLSFATPADPIGLGSCDLVAGENTLSATLVGENEAAMKDGTVDFYLDYIKLVPLP